MSKIVMADEVRERFEELRARQDAVVLEALTELWHRIPWGQRFTLSDGRSCYIEKFCKPESGHDGHQRLDVPHAGIDLKFDDGSHLEFFIIQTGWGSPLNSQRGGTA